MAAAFLQAPVLQREELRDAVTLPGLRRGKGLEGEARGESPLRATSRLWPLKSPYLLIAVVSRACLDRKRGLLDGNWNQQVGAKWPEETVLRQA